MVNKTSEIVIYAVSYEGRLFLSQDVESSNKRSEFGNHIALVKMSVSKV